MLWRFAAVFVSLFAMVAVVPLLLIDEEVTHYVEREELRTEFFSSLLEKASSSFDATTGRYVWGRTLKPSFSMTLHPLNFVQSYLQKKEFLWIGLTAGPWFIGLAILQFNYASFMVVNFYNVESGESWKSKITVPLLAPWIGARWLPNATGDIGPFIKGHSVEFSVPFVSQKAAIRFTGHSVQIDFAGTVQQRQSDGSRAASQSYEVHCEATLPEKVLGFVFPLGPRRAAVVGKVAAAPLHVPITLRLNGKEWRGDGQFSMDYTRGLLRRETRWHWVSATAPAGYGFHLSEGTYDICNKSVENTFYTAGKILLLDTAVKFSRESSSVNSALEGVNFSSILWKITGDGIELSFRRVDAHDGVLHLGILHADMDHAWGIFDGSILVNGKTYIFNGVAGVMEDHYALW